MAILVAFCMNAVDVNDRTWINIDITNFFILTDEVNLFVRELNNYVTCI